MQRNKWNRLWSKRCVQRAVSAGKSRVVLFSLVIGWDWHVIFKPITLRSGKNHCWLAFFLLFLTASDRTKSAHVGRQPRTNGDGRDLFGSWSWYKCCRRSKRAYLFGSFFKWLNVNAQLWVLPNDLYLLLSHFLPMAWVPSRSILLWERVSFSVLKNEVHFNN